MFSHLNNSVNSVSQISLDSDEITKVLGLLWIPSSDIFTFNVIPQDNPCTKRNVLSELARIFDPLGLLSPITLFIKYLMQQLWVLGLDWDDPVPDNLLKSWVRYKKELPLLSNFNLLRHINITFSPKLELHLFADASMKGNATVAYLKSIHDCKSYVYFVCSKTRVVPLIPRLELCAAVVLSDLYDYKNLSPFKIKSSMRTVICCCLMLDKITSIPMGTIYKQSY